MSMGSSAAARTRADATLNDATPAAECNEDDRNVLEPPRPAVRTSARWSPGNQRAAPRHAHLVDPPPPAARRAWGLPWGLQGTADDA